MINIKLRPHDLAGWCFTFSAFIFLEQADPHVAPQGRDTVLAQGLQQGWVWVQEKGMEAGKPQPSVSIAEFLITAHPSALNPSTPASSTGSQRPAWCPALLQPLCSRPRLWMLYQVFQLPSQHKSHCWQALPFCLCCYFLFMIKQCGKEARRPRGGGAETRSLI